MSDKLAVRQELVQYIVTLSDFPLMELHVNFCEPLPDNLRLQNKSQSQSIAIQTALSLTSIKINQEAQKLTIMSLSLLNRIELSKNN